MSRKSTIFLNDMQEAGSERVLLSIITVCYNAGDNLSRTMDSVREQSFPLKEYIVIDGASTDHTKAILKERRVEIDCLVSEPDLGIYNAMNKGLARAKGVYVCFMNAGDCFHSSDTLSELFHSLGDERPDVIYGETHLVNHEGVFIKPRRLKAPKYLTKNSFLKGMLVCHQSFYPKRDLAPFYDEQYRFSSDYDWCLNILSKSKTHFNSHLVLTDYLSEGITTQNRKASLIERYRIMRKHFGWFLTLLAHLYIAVRLLFK